MLDEANAKATFFVLGEVAEKFPELPREIVNRGHEVASHGFRHDLVYNITREEFEADIAKSVEILGNITGEKVLGYRAPSWSLNDKTPWAWEVLNQHGFKYDSSVYPYKTFLYGNASSPRVKYNIELESGRSIYEIPPSVIDIFGKRFPFSGGFFMRAAPLFYVSWCIRQFNRSGNPALIYLHPWEIDVGQPRLPLNPRDRFIAYVNLAKTEAKLSALLGQFQFTTIRDYLYCKQ